MKKIFLFEPCLTRAFFSHSTKSTIDFFSKRGISVKKLSFPLCCGQIHFNAGDLKSAKFVAKSVFRSLCKEDDPVVLNSASCTFYLREHFPYLLTPPLRRRWKRVKLYEFTEYVYLFLKETISLGKNEEFVFYHPSCHTLRGISFRKEPEELLKRGGINFHSGNPTCCGFGGIFSVKLPEVSSSMMGDKIDEIIKSDAKCVMSLDPGCLLNLLGGFKKRKIDIKIKHISEIL